jgi:hypothetical protein
MSKVAIATTMWAEVRPEIGEQREKQLKTEFWNEMRTCGCKIERFQNTYNSAWDIVHSITRMKCTTALRIQKEMVDDGKALVDTAAYGHAKDAEVDLPEGFLSKFRRFFTG